MGTIYGLLVMLCFASSHIISLPRRTSQGLMFVSSPGIFDLEKPKDGSKPPPGLASVGTRPWSPGLPDYKACARSFWSFPTGKYSDELPCRGGKKSGDGGTQTREPGVAGQDQGSGMSSMLPNPLSGRPQWGEEPVSKGSCPGFQTSLQVPRTAPAHVALAARGVRGPLPVMGGRVFRVHIPRG